MKKVMGLCALIHGQFKSDTDFAKHIGWSRQRLSRILNRTQPPTLDDIQEIADGLGVPVIMVVNFFLTKESTNV